MDDPARSADHDREDVGPVVEAMESRLVECEHERLQVARVRLPYLAQPARQARRVPALIGLAPIRESQYSQTLETVKHHLEPTRQRSGGTRQGVVTAGTAGISEALAAIGVRASPHSADGIEGQRTVMTTESFSAFQEWSMPGPQTT